MPVAPSLKDKLKQTSLRFHIQKDDKFVGVTKLSLINNTKEGFLPKIDSKNKQISNKKIEEKKDKSNLIE